MKIVLEMQVNPTWFKIHKAYKNWKLAMKNSINFLFGNRARVTKLEVHE